MPRIKHTILVGEDAFKTLKFECGPNWFDEFSLVIDGHEIKQRFIAFKITAASCERVRVEWESYEDALVPIITKTEGN